MVFGTAACAGAAIPKPTSSAIARVDVHVMANNFWRNLSAGAELLRLVASGVTVCILIGGQCRIDDGGVGGRSDEGFDRLDSASVLYGGTTGPD